MSEFKAVNLQNVVVQAAGKNIAPDSITVAMSTNSPLAVTVTGMPSDIGFSVDTAAAALEKMRDEIEGFQEEIFTAGLREPDYSVFVGSDGSGVVNLDGSLLCTGVTGGLAFGSAKMTYQLTDKLARMSAWSGGVYRLIPVVRLRGGAIATGNVYEAVRKAKGPIDVMIAILEQLYDEEIFKAAVKRLSGTNPLGMQAAMQTHEVNKKVKPEILEFLKANTHAVRFGGGDGTTLLSYGEAATHGVFDCIHQILTESPNMLEAIAGASGLPYYFGTQLVPTCKVQPSGFCSKLIDINAVYNAESIDLLTPITAIHGFSVGGGLLPVRSVNCPIAAAYTEKDSKPTGPERSMVGPAGFAYWPEGSDKLGPTSVGISAPLWLGRLPGTVQAVYNNRNQFNKPGVPPEKPIGERELQSDAIRDWLRMHYRFLALKSSTANVVMAFRPKVVCGTIYTVKVEAPDGSRINVFTGYADAVTHTIRIAGGGHASAETQVSFTHVRVGTFELRGA